MSFASVWLGAPTGPDFIPGALVCVPERYALTYLSELVRHLRPGTTVRVNAFGPDDSGRFNYSHDWKYTCT